MLFCSSVASDGSVIFGADDEKADPRGCNLFAICWKAATPTAAKSAEPKAIIRIWRPESLYMICFFSFSQKTALKRRWLRCGPRSLRLRNLHLQNAPRAFQVP